MIVATVTLAVALASSIYSGAIRSVEEDFNPSTEVAILGVSLFVLGFALGPLIVNIPIRVALLDVSTRVKADLHAPLAVGPAL